MISFNYIWLRKYCERRGTSANCYYGDHKRKRAYFVIHQIKELFKHLCFIVETLTYTQRLSRVTIVLESIYKINTRITSAPYLVVIGDFVARLDQTLLDIHKGSTHLKHFGTVRCDILRNVRQNRKHFNTINCSLYVDSRPSDSFGLLHQFFCELPCF